jgi:hypothetical protein
VFFSQRCRDGIGRAAMPKAGISGEDQDLLFSFYQTFTIFLKLTISMRIIAKYLSERLLTIYIAPLVGLAG